MAEFFLVFGDARRKIDAVQQRLANPKPTLRQFSKHLTASINQNIRAGGTGWPPYAESTLKKMRATGTSQITKRGTVRANRIARTVGAIKRIDAEVRANGWTDATRAKFAKLQKRLENFRKAEARAASQGARTAKAQQIIASLERRDLSTKDRRALERARKTVEAAKQDRLGKRVAENRQLLHNIPRTIRSKIDGNTLLTYSRADKIGKIHNEGSGRTPQRQFLPPTDMDAQLEYLAGLLEAEWGQAWDRT